MTASDHFILFRDDSGAWCAAPPAFRNLVLDPAGWGDTCTEAIVDLLRHREFHEGVKAGKWRMPKPADFIEVPEPEGAKIGDIDHETAWANIDAAIRRQSFKVISDG